MFPILFGIATALAFDALAYATYGAVALADYAWVDMISWGLVGAGFAIYALTRPLPAGLCRRLSLAHERLQRWLGLDAATPLCA
jgi:hypothetical protein